MIIPSVKITPVADLHCDLLSYLARGPSSTPHDPAVRCSIPQMREGGVKLQTLAIFTETVEGSSQRGQLQANAFRSLLKNYSDVFYALREPSDLERFPDPAAIAVILAIENASAFAEEDEDLELAFERLRKIHKKVGKVLYVSLTWNTDNRFGGCCYSTVGLKPDGKRLLDLLAQNNIAVDLSHASDRLAHDIFDYIDKHGLPLRVIASHSVMRAIFNAPRNLPDEIAKEIIKRGGLIGLNFVAKFIGPKMDMFLKHLERVLLFCGSKNVCFGADFFYDDDLPAGYRTTEKSFYDDFGNASSYPRLLQMIRRELHLPEEIVNELAHNNLVNFLRSTDAPKLM